MTHEYKTLLISVVSSVATILVIGGLILLWNIRTVDQVEIFGATILITGNTNTIDTFRTNVNTSLTNINNQLATLGNATTTLSQSTGTFVGFFSNSSTLVGDPGFTYDSTTDTVSSTNAFHTSVSGTQISVSAYGLFPNLFFTSASGTQISASVYGLFPTLGFTSASGTQISVSGYGNFPTLNFTNASGGIVTSTRLSASDVLRIPFDKTINSTGSIMVNTTTGTLAYNDGTRQVGLLGTTCSDSFTIIGETAAAKDVDTAFWTAPATGTITSFVTTQKFANENSSWQAVWSSTRQLASSGISHAFLLDYVSSTGAKEIFTPTASSSINAQDIMRIFFKTSSSSEFTISVCVRYNP